MVKAARVKKSNLSKPTPFDPTIFKDAVNKQDFIEYLQHIIRSVAYTYYHNGVPIQVRDFPANSATVELVVDPRLDQGETFLCVNKEDFYKMFEGSRVGFGASKVTVHIDPEMYTMIPNSSMQQEWEIHEEIKKKYVSS